MINSMIINVHNKQKIHIFATYEEFKFFHKLLFGVSLGGTISHMLPGTEEKPMFEEMFKRFEHVNNQLNEKKIWL